MGLSISDLEALCECVEIVENLVEAGAEAPEFLALAAQAGSAATKVRREIKRRNNRQKVRNAVKMAQQILAAKSTIGLAKGI